MKNKTPPEYKLFIVIVCICSFAVIWVVVFNVHYVTGFSGYHEVCWFFLLRGQGRK